jgi:hypothetical protein
VLKEAKPEFFFMLIVVAAISFFVGSLFTSNTGALTSVQSSITDSDLGPSKGYFEVPEKRIAKDFSSVISRATKGWGIYPVELVMRVPVPTTYSPVYHTAYGDLSNLKLLPGKYAVMVDGWEGAETTVYYTVE